MPETYVTRHRRWHPKSCGGSKTREGLLHAELKGLRKAIKGMRIAQKYRDDYPGFFDNARALVRKRALAVKITKRWIEEYS